MPIRKKALPEIMIEAGLYFVVGLATTLAEHVVGGLWAWVAKRMKARRKRKKGKR